ncbi:MucB/RseB C-terminal domain-containing protein [Methylogaea oryzae]|uniref:MucB/RseB C-terminal domain-containing protein n=1 Tax=Methylogaea oryzae TaxID=1295382 RepID=UPI0006D25247|nr:MucB/RseB C-terminal domain-containing protein [Methylogaea oryzae]
MSADMASPSRSIFFVIRLMLLVCCSCSAFVAAAEAPQDALGWLTAMRDARKNLDFTGKAALLRDSQVQIVAVEHAVVNGTERECMHSLDQPGHEIVRQAGSATYFLPEAQRSVAGGKPLRVDGLGTLPEDLASYQRFYRFNLGAREQLIGRSVQEVLIEPLDEYRYGRRYWIDVDSKLPLKYQALNGERVLEQLVFSELSLNKAAVGTFPEHKAAPYVQEALPLESLQWRLERVPPGYRLVSYMRHSAPGKKPVEHLLLSDGLSALSLYIEESDGAAGLKKQVRHFGAMHFYSRAMNGYQITVMGEAPLAAVGLVGDGVERAEQR